MTGSAGKARVQSFCSETPIWSEARKEHYREEMDELKQQHPNSAM